MAKKLKKAKITASQDELIDEGLYPQFCKPGMIIFISESNKNCEFVYYCDYPGGSLKTINKNFFEYV